MSCCHCSVNGCNGFQCKERLQEKCVAISNCHFLEYAYLLEDLICSETDISTLLNNRRVRVILLLLFVRRGVKKCIVKSQSMSNHGINTARSPWINRKGIEVSEWII